MSWGDSNRSRSHTTLIHSCEYRIAVYLSAYVYLVYLYMHGYTDIHT